MPSDWLQFLASQIRSVVVIPHVRTPYIVAIKFLLTSECFHVILRSYLQLFDFRTRLHKALECYYKLRGAQTRAGIVRFEERAKQNGQRLQHIQESLKETLDNITEFLAVNNASHKAIRIEAEETAKGVVGISA